MIEATTRNEAEFNKSLTLYNIAKRVNARRGDRWSKRKLAEAESELRLAAFAITTGGGEIVPVN